MIDEFGRAYTTDKFEAANYRVRDRQINYHAIKNNYVPPIKYINFFTWDKVNRVFWLPPSC